MDAGFVAVNRDLNTVDRANDTQFKFINSLHLMALLENVGMGSKYEWSPDATGYSNGFLHFILDDANGVVPVWMDYR